ncbi:MAG: F0F1 ATP synthase subunit epsilon [Cellulosilyticaceae bacterium]
MADKKINLQIITPTRLVLDELVDSVVLCTKEGDMGILYDHEPVVTLLSYGILRYKQDGQQKKATIMGGFAEVTEDRVTILADSSELENEIDLNRAKQCKVRAESRLKKSDYDEARLQIALRKSLIRIKLAEGN